jgi:hypothetical protein
LTYANVAATLALILALGGTSYAAVTINGASIQRKSIPLDRLKGSLPAGKRGATGARGAAGLQGVIGAIGAQGLPGAPGMNGGLGERGIRGPKGDQGLVGTHGATGATGSQGPIGPDGPAGPAGLVNDTVFHGADVSNQSSGDRHELAVASGLEAGNYLVSFRLDLFPGQLYSCGVARDSVAGSGLLRSSRTTVSSTDTETCESSGVVTLGVTDVSQVLYCKGESANWDAEHVQLHFIRIDAVTEGGG